MNARSVSFYARAIKRELPASALAPAHSRLLWLPTHLVNIVVCTWALAQGWVPGWLAAGVSVLIGASFAGLTFLAHETLHGAVWCGGAQRGG